MGIGMNDKRAVPTVQLENEHLRVTEWRFAPGAATGYHRHAHDYVVVPVVDGELELVGPDGGRSRARLEQGKSYFRNAGVEHDVINAGVGVMSFVEIELKDTSG
jgi:quercetin dioxygenase-like cupin family protein